MNLVRMFFRILRDRLFFSILLICYIFFLLYTSVSLLKNGDIESVLSNMIYVSVLILFYVNNEKSELRNELVAKIEKLQKQNLNLVSYYASNHGKSTAEILKEIDEEYF